MDIDNLRALFVHELKDLLSAETQITKALPKLAKKAQSPTLKEALESHLDESTEHVSRIERILDHLDAGGKQHECKGMKGLIDEGNALVDAASDSTIDAGIIAAAQRVEHYEIAAYGTAAAFAALLNEPEAADMLTRTLEEEKKADETLSRIAMSEANEMALHADDDAT